MNVVRYLYRTIFPEPFRKKILVQRRIKKENKIKKEILVYYKKNPSNDSEINEALVFLSQQNLTVFPYPFFLDYISKKIDLFTDHPSGLPYVIYNSKKLFFKKSWNLEHIENAFRFLLAEQDKKSGHCYLTENYDIADNAVVLDVGAAEGIFAIHKIEKIKHLYLIETDPEWIECLKETYKPWIDKVTIINKFVSNIDDDKNIRIDSYFRNTEALDFVKIDVDGAERNLLAGAEETIAKKIKNLAICTYHKQGDNEEFSSYLKNKNYTFENSKGYMLFYFEGEFYPPYFRRGLIRAKKNIS